MMALPSFPSLDAKVYAALHQTTVFKVKVFDARGITVYSSEHRQIGEDAQANAGWQRAAAGQPASELTHRDRFSAFERVVEDRDLISTYVPVRAAGTGPVVGVFELYSDVTPFLQQTRAASHRFGELTAANEARAALAARDYQDRLVDSSNRLLWTVGVLLVLLYVVSLLIVRRGQRIIDAQQWAQQQAAQRERDWHREKMAALATMAANIAHEVGNPLAVVAGVAGLLPEIPGQEDAARQILAQTQRIAHMTRQIADFASQRGAGAEWLDVNARVKAVCDFLSFDRRLRGTPIDVQPCADLPARELVADHVDELTMNLLQALADGAAQYAPGARLRVCTELRGDDLVMRAGLDTADGDDWPPQARLDALERRARDAGARLQRVGSAVELVLPVPPR
jgi:signal transduction histidine kinase